MNNSIWGFDVVLLLTCLQGCMDFHNDIHRLMIRLFKWRNVPLEKCVARLWECRRISHGLCASPVNEAFIMNLSDHCGENSKSIEFWVDCLKGSKPLLLAFQYNFSSVSPNFPRGSCNYESSFRSDITIDEVKEAAFELISSVSSSQVATMNSYALMMHINTLIFVTLLIGSCIKFVCLHSWISLL